MARAVSCGIVARDGSKKKAQQNNKTTITTEPGERARRAIEKIVGAV
jgi:hypothetical protein